jgi:predicted enzyme related to lactoylglutathione lyase
MADAPRPNFIELPTRDLERSKAFYRSVFAWTMTDFGPTYACTLSGDVDLGLQADPTEASRAPLPVVCVSDLDAAFAAVVAAGGRIVKPIFAFPGGRRFQFLDPSDNELAVMAVASETDA